MQLSILSKSSSNKLEHISSVVDKYKKCVKFLYASPIITNIPPDY